MFQLLRKIAMDSNGATAIEYGLIAALVAMAGIAAFDNLSISLSNVFGGVDSAIGGIVEELARCKEVDSNCKK